MLEELLENKYEMSLGKIILVFILLLNSTTLFPLLSKQWKRTLESNRMAQHILGIITLMAIVTLFSNGRFSIQRIIMYTIIGYFVFILSTKLDLQWNVIIMTLLLAFFLYQETNSKKDIEIEQDPSITREERNEIQKKNKSNYIIITLAIIGAIIMGNFLYSDKKEVQYGGGYSLSKFLLE
jgi:Mn2+/Fe2+ NRAMP family transporter